MPKSCLVCNVKFEKGSARSFHRFPKNIEQKKGWCEILGITENIHYYEVLCSDHFSPRSIRTSPAGKRSLVKGAIPIAVSVLQPMNIERNKSAIESVNDGSTSSEEISGNPSIASELEKENQIPIECGLHKQTKRRPIEEGSPIPLKIFKMISANDSPASSSTLTASETEREYRRLHTRKTLLNTVKLKRKVDRSQAYKRRWKTAQKILINQRLVISNQKRQISRLKARLATYRKTMIHLKKNNFLSTSAEAIIDATVPQGSKAIMKRIVGGPSKKQYPPELRAFALTLSFYGMKSYQYVREKFNNCLPHPDTISKWYRSIDGSPGFTEESLKILRLKVQSGEKVLCSLVLDEMAIMQRVEWTGAQFTGFIDVGRGIQSEDLPQAKEVLVFMLVAINGHWKIPVGYFCINGLKGFEKSCLVKELLKLIHSTGVTITSITFDGTQANLRMCHCLGANFHDVTNLVTYFPHPVTCKPVYIFLDSCHMLKLWRNCLGTYKVLNNGNGKNICWKYFEELVELQQAEGLHAATKIRKRHILWKNERQKVKIATQTFSNSVSDALTFLEKDLKLEQFQNAEATAEFCKIGNNLFDIFNSRSQFAKYDFQKCLSPKNSKKILEYLDKYKTYILGLEFNGISILLTDRKTGFLGYLICIESLKSFYEYYVNTEQLLKYIPTYKFSQDHIEVFFSAVRSRGGFNNNPTAKQFQAIYKRLLVHTEIKGSSFANAVALDSTTILSVSSVTKSSTGENLEESLDYIDFFDSCQDHDYVSSPSWHLTMFVEDIVSYISGFVVKCLKKCVVCIECLSMLESNETFSLLQKRKCYGKMINASKFVINICKKGETYLRIYRNQNNLFSKNINILNVLVSGSLRNLKTHVMEFCNEHSYENDPLNEHPLQLTKLILKHYFKIRIHHETFQLKDNVTHRVRSLLTKTILLKNQ